MSKGRITPIRVRDHIDELIRSGRFSAGDRLPTERELARILVASRNAVRDGLMMIEAEGRIRRVAGSGTYVTPQDSERRNAWSPRLASPAEIMDARLALEPRLARIAAIHATTSDIERMTMLDLRAHDNLESGGFEAIDAELHAVLASATQNRLLVSLYELITASRDQAVWGEFKRRSGTTDNRRIYCEEHRAIIEAIRNRIPDAAEQAVTQHLKTVRAHMFGD